jgi:hypothetical protein
MTALDNLLASLLSAIFTPVERREVWQWADEHFRIPQIVGSPNPGPFDSNEVPPWKSVFEQYWRRDVHFITICKSARVGGTLFSILALSHKVDIWPGPILWVDPTRKTAVRVSRNEIEAFLLECGPVKAKAVIDKKHWTTLERHFLGCTFGMVGAGSAAELAGRQAELLILNETDKLKHDLKAEAPPHELAIARTKQFRHTRKIIENSTPTTERARAWSRFKAGNQQYCYLPCPHCRTMQRLTFFSEEKEVPFCEDGTPLPEGETRVEKTGRFKFDHCRDGEGEHAAFDHDEVERSTVYECGTCQKDINHTSLNWMLRRHQWRAHRPNAPKDHVSFHFWAAYSPFEHWGVVAKKFLAARGSIGRMHDFYNSDLGLPFVRHATEIKEDDLDLVVKRSPEYFLRQIPRKPLLLTMTVDVQQSCFWWSIRAWGLLEDHADVPTWSALIDYGSAVSWAQIEEIAGITPDRDGKTNKYIYADEFGEVTEHTVYAGLIDSGFEAKSNKNVYAFCIRNADVFSPSKGGGWQQLRGMTIRSSPVEDDQLDLLWYEDDGFKQQLFYHSIKEGKALWWLPRNIDATYKAQLMSERTKEVTQPDGSTKLSWVVEGEDGNHLADTEKMHLVLSEVIEQGEAFTIARDELNAKNKVAPVT